jgi:hypothetical protein
MMAKFKVGDRVRLVSDDNRHLGLRPGDVGTVVDDSMVPFVNWDRVNDKWAVLDNEIEPVAVAPATAAPEIEITGTLELTRTPAVGDDVLIPAWITAISSSRKGTVYSIAFETKNRRVSLDFTEEDFIALAPDDEGCPCDNNDNGPAPNTDTAKAFDALANSIFGLTVRRAA